MKLRASLAAVVALTAGLALRPATASATDAATPRTPPIFKQQTCLRVVDRSVDPVFHLDFAIPFEDDALTMDEPADSRTFQFFAMCRDVRDVDTIPNWIDTADIDAALAAGALTDPPASSEILAGHPDWSIGHDGMEGTCVQPLNLAADRIPITCAATDGGLDWDTTGVPAGNYAIYGYTFMPALNLWTRRVGLVRIHDGDDTAIGPVVSLTSPDGEDIAYEDPGYAVRGCVEGIEGTTVTVQWSKIADDPDDDASWHTVCADVDASQGTFEVQFVPPPEAVNQAVHMRAIATDPQGRTWTGVAPGLMLVFPGEGRSASADIESGPDFCGAYPGDRPDSGGGGGACLDEGPPTGTGGTTSPADSSGGTTNNDDTGPGDTSAATSTSASSTTEPAGDDDSGGGCGCRSGSGPDTPWWLWAPVVAVMRARSRRSRRVPAR